MTACEACGKAILAGIRFCIYCGAMLTGPAQGAGEARSSIPEECLSWERKIPLITNPYLVLQCIFIPLGIGVLLGLFFWLITGAGEMLVMFLILGGFLAILFLFVMVVLHLVTHGGLSTTFFIGSKGVAHSAGSTTRSLNRASTGGSVLLGSMGGTGAGMLAMSQEENMLRWEEVRYISVFPRVRSVVLRSKYLISPVVLYCTEKNFDAVLTMIRTYAPPVATRNL